MKSHHIICALVIAVVIYFVGAQYPSLANQAISKAQSLGA